MIYLPHTNMLCIVYNKHNKYTNMDLEQFKEIRDKFESSYTIIINGLSVENTISTLYKKLDTINQMKDNVKRKYLNDRIYSLIEHFSTFAVDDILHNIYLLGATLNIIPLNKTHMQTMSDWSVPAFIFRNGEYFDIEYIQTLLLDESYYDIIKIMNKQVTHIHLGKEKRRSMFDQNVSSDFDLATYIKENVKGKCLVHGVSSLTKSFKPINTDILVFPKALTDDQIIQEFHKAAMYKIHEKVNELLGYIQNEKMMHRVLTGKDIQKAIQYSQIETLYCSTKMINKILSKVPKDLQTFKIVEVSSLEKGDAADILENSYMGLLGLTYF